MSNYNSIRLTGSGIISTSPTFLGLVAVTPKDTKKGSCNVYDGESTSDPIIISIQTLTGETKVINFYPVLETKRGLYIDFTGDLLSVFVQYQRDRE